MKWRSVEATLGLVRFGWDQWDSVEIVRGQLGVNGGWRCSLGVFGAQRGSLGLSGGQWSLVGDQWDSVRLGRGQRAMYIYQGPHFKGRYNFATEETSNSGLISSIKFDSKLISNSSLIKLKFLK